MVTSVQAPAKQKSRSCDSDFREQWSVTLSEYHKIQTIFKRDMASKRKTLMEGDWTLPEFEYLAGNAWTFTEKVAGTNIRVIFKDGALAFGGRTEDAGIPAPLLRG